MVRISDLPEIRSATYRKPFLYINGAPFDVINMDYRTLQSHTAPGADPLHAVATMTLILERVWRVSDRIGQPPTEQEPENDTDEALVVLVHEDDAIESPAGIKIRVLPPERDW